MLCIEIEPIMLSVVILSVVILIVMAPTYLGTYSQKFSEKLPTIVLCIGVPREY
jgi:hypothetical protein